MTSTTPLVWLASFILWLGGWEKITPEFRARFLRYPKKIVIFPHTTYWDFVILVLYGLVDWPEYHRKVYVVVKPQLLTGWKGRIFSYFNCIPATMREEEGKGFVSRTAARFVDQPEASIFIAPDGTIERSEWKTGFYHLAKLIDCPIQVVGLDYHLHCPIIYEPVAIGELEPTKALLVEQMSGITPLYPENSVVPHLRRPTSLFSYRNISTVLIWVWVYLALIQSVPAPTYLWIALLSLTYLQA